MELYQRDVCSETLYENRLKNKSRENVFLYITHGEGVSSMSSVYQSKVKLEPHLQDRVYITLWFLW